MDILDSFELGDMMNEIKWKFITFKLWRCLFFKLRKVEQINEKHTRGTYTPRTLNDLKKLVKR